MVHMHHVHAPCICMMHAYAMFLRVLHAEQEILEADEAASRAMDQVQKGASNDQVRIPAVQFCPALKDGHMICMDRIDARSLNGTMAKSYKAVWHFLFSTQWKPTTEGGNSSSWVEIFAHFIRWGAIRVLKSSGPLL